MPSQVDLELLRRLGILPGTAFPGGLPGGDTSSKGDTVKAAPPKTAPSPSYNTPTIPWRQTTPSAIPGAPATTAYLDLPKTPTPGGGWGITAPEGMASWQPGGGPSTYVSSTPAGQPFEPRTTDTAAMLQEREAQRQAAEVLANKRAEDAATVNVRNRMYQKDMMQRALQQLAQTNPQQALQFMQQQQAMGGAGGQAPGGTGDLLSQAMQYKALGIPFTAALAGLTNPQLPAEAARLKAAAVDTPKPNPIQLALTRQQALSQQKVQQARTALGGDAGVTRLLDTLEQELLSGASNLDQIKSRLGKNADLLMPTLMERVSDKIEPQLTTQGQKDVGQVRSLLPQINTMIQQFEAFKDMPGWNTMMGMAPDYWKYAYLGVAPSEAELQDPRNHLASLVLTNVRSVVPYMRGMRNLQWVERIEMHLPKPGLDSFQNAYEKLHNMRDTVHLLINEAYKSQRKSGIVPREGVPQPGGGAAPATGGGWSIVR